MFFNFRSSRTSSEPASALPPLVTRLLALACITVFLCIALNQQDPASVSIRRLGYRTAIEVWGGAYWSLLSNVFIHQEIWHLAFNVYWLWILGGCLERTIGSFRFLLFCAAAAFVSSAFQLATGDTGIGMSGVGYAIFGFMWIARRSYPAFQQVLNQQLIQLFIGWLFACFLLTYLKIMAIGNAAHFSGLAFGAAVAGCFVIRRKTHFMAAGLAALLAFAVVPLFWCPWSVPWLCHQAYRAIAARRYQDAIALCDRIIHRDPENAWAWYTRGASYYYQGDLVHSKNDVATAHQLDPKINAD